jgi:oxygen-dependent protoporphyrinogen oxidase
MMDGEAPVAARAVVLALPAATAASLISDAAPVASERLGAFRANAAGTISLAFRTADATRPLSGYGLVIPAREGSPINAITEASRKFPGRAPANWTLFRVFFGGARSPRTMLLDEEELLSVVMRQLRALVGVSSDPAFYRIQRWPAGSPLYEVGHLDRVAAVEQALPAGLFVTGSPFRGVGVPDIVRDSRTTAAAVYQRLALSTSVLDLAQ